MRTVASGVAAGLGLGVVALGSVSIMAPTRIDSFAASTEAAVQIGAEAPAAPAEPQGVTHAPSVPAAPAPETSVTFVPAPAALQARDGHEELAVLPPLAGLPAKPPFLVEEFEGGVPSLLTVAPGWPSSGIPSPLLFLMERQEALVIQAAPVIPAAPAVPERTAADVALSAQAGDAARVAADSVAPERPPVAATPEPQPRWPSPEIGPAAEPAPAGLALTAKDPAPQVAAALAPTEPTVAGDLAPPRRPMPIEDRTTTLPMADVPTIPLRPARPEGAAPDGLIVVQATATAEPTPVVPKRIALEGGALPSGGTVRVRRPDAEAADAAAPAPEAALAEDAPALLRHAAAFTAPETEHPLLSLVLLDDGSLPDPVGALAAGPFPVSVALDAAAPDAAARMDAYRAAGIEVLALARLPEGAQPVDAEVFLGGTLDLLPEAVAVLDLGEGGLRGRDATAASALARLARGGLGAVLVAGGLGRDAEAAEAAGVPAAEILRDLDGAGQDDGAIRRALDDAVLRAKQEGEAVVLGRLKPETLAALAAWSQHGRAPEVTVAPVSLTLSSNKAAAP